MNATVHAVQCSIPTESGGKIHAYLARDSRDAQKILYTFEPERALLVYSAAQAEAIAAAVYTCTLNERGRVRAFEVQRNRAFDSHENCPANHVAYGLISGDVYAIVFLRPLPEGGAA